jgi:hypothetical protein
MIRIRTPASRVNPAARRLFILRGGDYPVAWRSLADGVHKIHSVPD